MRGRVSAVNWLFIGASNEFGEFESGVTAQWWGAVPAVVIGGIASMVVTASASGFSSVAQSRCFDGRISNGSGERVEYRGASQLDWHRFAGARVE